MMKQAKLASQARLPELARPPATPTKFDSAMPTLKKRSGNFLAKKSVRVELCTSPSTTTISGYFSPAAANAMPKASRVDFPVFIPISHTDCDRSSRALLELGECHFGFLGRQWFTVMIWVAGKQMLNRITLDRAGDDGAGPPLGFAGPGKSRHHFVQIVAVDFLRVPAERFEARNKRPQVENLGRRAGLLKPVLIDDGDHAIKLVLLRRHPGPPH